MSVIGHSPLAGASGAAGGSADPLYVDDVFSTFLYEGTNSAKTITNGIDLSGEGGLVWIKSRSQARDNILFDTERGATKLLKSNAASAEITTVSGGTTYGLTSFTSSGFTLAENWTGENESGADTCSWTFRKAPKFFDVVTYSGTGSVQNISHSLGSVPGMIIIHCRDGSHDWEVYHRSTGATKSLHLNKEDGNVTDSTVWNNTTPTSSVFTVGTSTNVNQNGHGYVAYVFAHDEQAFGTDSDEAIIKCGSFTTPSSGTVTVDLGFEPQWLMTKVINYESGWRIRDVMRGWSKTMFQRLFPHSSSAEQETSSDVYFPINNTGFSSNTDWLGSNNTIIYMAIRRPHKPPTAATEVFNPINDVGSSSSRKITAGNLVDLVISKSKASSSYPWYWLDRLRGATALKSNSTAAESNSQVSSTTFDEMNGIYVAATDGWTYASPYGGPYAKYFFTRTPGFFDVVAYTGSNSSGSTSYTHNLKVVPELMVIKARNAGGLWYVYSSVTGNSKFLRLNGNQAESTGVTWTTPTATEFTAFSGVNATHENYLVFLFSTLDSVSKVGSYTGTGNNINVDCGFTGGARFVLIKRTDSTGDWYVWDTASGIVSGNDPYLLVNSTAAEVTNTDYIDPLNAGLTETSSAPAALNASGGTYLFLAIA